MDNILSSFDTVSSKTWKQKIQVDLKGEEYNSLLWQTLEGIAVKPFYHFDEDNTTLTVNHPATWNIAQQIFVADAKIANKIAKNAIENGAETITFLADEPFDIIVLLDSVKIDSIYIKLNFLDEKFMSDLLNYSPHIILQIDPIGQLTTAGNWFKNKPIDFELLKRLLGKFPNRKILSIDNTATQNSGANIVQQIAYVLAHVNEYFNEFGVKIAKQFTFEFATGYNYFFEIAKLKAFRYLYQQLLAEYGKSNVKAVISTIPSKRNKTLYDYNVNMLRTTNEAMSAILGGSDIVHNLPYDALYHKSNIFAERIARNQLLILKKESGFDALNAVQGAYYIESVVIALAEKALEIFKSIEKGGGYLKLLFAGTIQRKIKESAAKEQALFDKGQLTLIGTNILQNTDEQMQNDLALYPFMKVKPRKTLIEPFIPKRLAEKIEKERLDSEK